MLADWLTDFIFDISIRFLITALIIFLVIRQLALWYWKVNHIVDRLESIDKHLRVIAMRVDPDYDPDSDDDENENIEDPIDGSLKTVKIGKKEYKVKK